MNKTFGIDTSNYATSVAVFDCETFEVKKHRQLLPVKNGELGLRQSDAVFYHVKQFPEVVAQLKNACDNISAVGVSIKPRWVEGSYMPCFLVGEAITEGIATTHNCEVFKTSHQVGHILSALYSCEKLDLLKADKPFLAFHVSGGTTDLLLCTPDKEQVLITEEIAHSLDLKAGQLIDRVGLMLGLQFPCGVELEKLAEKSDKTFRIKPTLKGMDCCLSGGENKCQKMLENGEKPEDIASFALFYVYSALRGMTQLAKEKYGDLEIIYAGGVMSDRIISDKLKCEFGGCFAKPDFSCDNAVGVALFSAIKKGLI